MKRGIPTSPRHNLDSAHDSPRQNRICRECSDGPRCSSPRLRSSPWRSRQRQLHASPHFTLTDENGKFVRISDRKGKVVLLNFWATWCGGCQVEIPWFKNFY